ncbi:MAG: Ig-like domain-containing protein [Caldilineaceae bacterium]|nr:Ig-like domain-containing protein [Caldilineaceae bacterium]
MRNRVPTPKIVAILLLTLLLVTTAMRLLPFPANAAHATATRPLTTTAGQAAQAALVPPQQELPPVLLSTTPSEGTVWDGGAVTFIFDQPMAAASNVSLAVIPSLAGEVTVEEATLRFTPSTAPTPGERYHFTIDADATSAAGIALGNPAELTLVAAAPLAVTTTQPRDGASEVDTDSQVVIVFNRPVVALTSLNDQRTLPQPLTIEPAVEGSGEWLNTSLYVFKPTRGLAGGTEYTLTIADLTTVQGETLAAPVVTTFTTAAPIVTDTQPNSGLIAPDSAFQVTFSQPMDPASTEAAFTFTANADDEAVAGSFAWNEANTTLTFTPTQSLAFGGLYRLAVDQSAQPASQQGNLREAYELTLSVVPLPAVASTTPASGATNVSPDVTVSIQFNAPLSATTVLPNITVSPMLTTTRIYSYYWEYNNTVELSWFKESQTTYTVTLGADITDRYGNTLGEPQTLTFTTGDHSPFVQLGIERFTHFSAYTETRISTLYRNVSAVEARLYRLPASQAEILTGENQWEIWRNYRVPDPAQNLVWERSYEPIVGPNVTARQVLTLTDDAGNLPAPGFYFLQVSYPEYQPNPDDQSDPFANKMQALLVLSNNNLVLKKSTQGDSLAWVTDLATGKPVADIPVRFYYAGQEMDNTTTNSDGVALAALNLDPNNNWGPTLAISGEPGEPNFAAASSEWSQGIGPWDFNIPGGYSTEPIQSYFYTDRPIYRPGQTVYWKGIIRQLVNDQHELPAPTTAISITIRDDQGNPIQEDRYTLDENGTLHGEVTLAPEAITGYYYLEARIQVGDTLETQRTVYGGVGFQVAAYRKPEFAVTVTSDQPEYTNGDTITYTVQASYFSGGPLANAPVTWRLLAEPYNFTWPNAPTEARFFSFTPFDPENDVYDPYRGVFAYGLIQEGSSTTNAAGTFTLALPAELQDALQSQRWTLDVTIQSATNQFISGRAAVPVHRGEFYVGLSPRSYVNPVGEESTINVVTITPQGEPYPGVALTATIYEFNWNSVYEQAADGSFAWQTSVERTPIVTTTVTTARDGRAVIAWTPATGGEYQIVASGEDDAGNQISSATYVWVSGGDFIAWPRQNNDRMELVADKKLYAPGDTAKILIPSPFAGPVDALVTLERGGVLETELITLTSNSATLEVPITTTHIPNIFVSVIIAKGIDETNPVPALRVGYVQLNVDTSEKVLTIDVAPSATTLQPGDTISYTLTIRDSAGTPVPHADVSVALVDKAVLSLVEGMNQTLLELFYYQRPLGVTTGASLIINSDRLSQQLSEGAKGGGGGGGASLLEVREEFPDIAFWRADLTSDENGEITFQVDLPDNLTTWRLAAKAITLDTRVGETVNDVVATKALQVRPLLPRFFTAGDRSSIGAVILNTTASTTGTGTFSLTIAGATLADGTTSAAMTDLAMTALGQASYNFPITVQENAASVVVTMTAQTVASADNPALGDAIRLTIPIVRYETPEVVATSGTVPPEGRLEALRLPDAATDNGELQLNLEPSLAAGMLDGLDYLEHFAYECNEQTVSRFLPNLFTVRALKSLGIENEALTQQLNFQLGVAVQRLVSRQNGDGGWGYWPGEESNAFVTSYVLWGLGSAAEMDYTVPARAISRAATYLDGQFQAPSEVTDSWTLNQMAFMNFVLAEIGQGDPGRASTLYEVRERLDLYGQALLAMALAKLDETGETNARSQTLLDNLSGAAQLSATGASWHETSTDWWNLNTDTRTTSIILAAFVRLQPAEPLLPQVVRWLMSAREAGRWATTQENAWAIIALTDWMATSGELAGNYDWTVTLNAQVWEQGTVNADNLTEKVQLRTAVTDLLRDEANALLIERSNESGQLYYTTYLRYYLDALAIDARDRGIVVDRRFALADQRVQSAQVGDVISVTVTVVAPTDLYQALVEVPIPAGTEPIDPRLATTSVQYDQLGQLIPANAGKPDWFWLPTYVDVRDEKVALVASYLPAGTYEYTFQVQATVPGEYRVLPAHAEMLYFPEVWGRSAGALFTVTE